jgi:hypothetical protein
MTKPLIPPRGVFISSRILFHPDMPSAVVHTLIQLIALSWDSQDRMTAPLSFRTIAGLTSKSVRTIYGHLSALQNKYAALRLQTAGDGIFVVILAGWLFEPLKPGELDCKNLQTPVKEEQEELTSIESENNLVLLNDSDQEEEYEGKPQKIAKFSKHKPLRKSIRALSPGLRDQLLAAGVFPSLLDEIAVSPYSEEDLTALLAWSTHDQPDNPAPLLIGRLRKLANPPKIYRQPPCPVCGMAGGKHKDDCHRRHLSGSFAETPDDK